MSQALWQQRANLFVNALKLGHRREIPAHQDVSLSQRSIETPKGGGQVFKKTEGFFSDFNFADHEDTIEAWTVLPVVFRRPENAGQTTIQNGPYRPRQCSRGAAHLVSSKATL